MKEYPAFINFQRAITSIINQIDEERRKHHTTKSTAAAGLDYETSCNGQSECDIVIEENQKIKLIERFEWRIREDKNGVFFKNYKLIDNVYKYRNCRAE
jgi:hypothetical protein